MTDSGDCHDLDALRARSAIARIADNVYLANFFAAKDRKKLAAVGITHILVCAQELPHVLRGDSSLTYERLKLADNPGSELPLDQALAFADVAGVRRLVTFHHDPGHDDAQLDDLFDEATSSPLPFELLRGEEGASFEV